MKLAIFGRLTDKTDPGVLARWFRFLRDNKVSHLVHREYGESLRPLMPGWEELVKPVLAGSEEVLSGADFAYSMGGDGTLLNTVRLLGGRDIPVLGVNFGRLGFLTSVTQEHLVEATEDILRGIYRTDQRHALVVESSPQGLFGQYNFGMNDLTIHKSNSNEMITVHTYINGEFLNSYWGDGLIVSTPTGSTAYNLACGGPVIHPQASAFVITPVAPHSLTVRPMVIPDHYVISFEIESRSGQAMVALDTRTELVNDRVEIAVRKSEFAVNLVRMQSAKYLDMLRDRLMWGRDSRN